METMEFLFKTVVAWLIFPAYYGLVVPLFCWRLCVQVLAKILHPDWIGMMSTRDVFVSENLAENYSFSQSTAENKQLLTCVSYGIDVCKGVPNLEKIRAKFVQNVLNYETPNGDRPYSKFMWFYEIWLGFFFWKLDTQFNIENHIKFLDKSEFQKNGTKISKSSSLQTSEEELVQIMAVLGTRNFQQKMPPWQFLIVPNFVPKDCYHDDADDDDESPRFAIVVIFHHTLMDGFSRLKIISQHMGKMELKTMGSKPKLAAKKKGRDWSRLFWDCLKTFTAVGVEHYNMFFLWDINPWHHPLAKLTGHLHTVSMSKMAFKNVQLVSRKLGVSTTTIFFSAVAGGIRAFFEKEMQKTGQEIPEIMRTLFTLPVSAQDHPMEGMVNHWTFYNMPLSIREPSPATRIQDMERSFRKLKDSLFPDLAWLISPLFMAVPNWLIKICAANRMTTMTMSNFPGPASQIVLFDEWPLEDIIVFLPRLKGNPGLTIMVHSYMDSFRLTLAVDQSVMPLRSSAVKLIEYIHAEFESIQKLHSDDNHNKASKHSCIG